MGQDNISTESMGGSFGNTEHQNSALMLHTKYLVSTLFDQLGTTT